VPLGGGEKIVGNRGGNSKQVLSITLFGRGREMKGMDIHPGAGGLSSLPSKGEGGEKGIR